MAGLHFDITGDNTNLLRKLQETENGVKSVSRTVEKEGGNIEDLFNRLARSAAAIGVGFSAKEFISKAAQIRGEFQKLEVAFTTMLGSKEQAEKLMEQMVRTAATTPFSLQDVAGGAKQLLAYGIEAERVNETLIRLGDIAAGLSIPLGDLVYLYGTTRAQGRLYTEDFNQFTSRGIPMIEMLADKFGVAESEVKGLVEAGKVGFPEVQEVIEKLTNEGGKFGGLMEAQSKTIAGQISNIEDAIETMFNEIGKANEGVINEALSGVSSLIENYEKVGTVIASLVAVYGTYKVAVMTVTALQSLQATGIAALTTKEVIHYGWLVATQKAQMLLNATMLANPYVAVAVAVAGVAAAIWNFHDSSTEAEKAQKRLNERQQEAQKEAEDHKRKIDALIESSRDIALSDLQRGQSLAELRKEYPKIFAQYDIETIKLADILKLKQKISEEDARQAGEKQKQDFANIESEIAYYENLLKSLSGQQGVDGYVKKLKELRAERDILLQDKGKGISEQFISSLKDIDINEFDRYISELEKRIKGKGENGKIKMRLPIDVKGSLSDEALFEVKDIKTLIDTAKSTKQSRIDAKENQTNYQKDYDAAKKAWEEAKKKLEEIENDKKAFTSKLYEDAKTDYNDKKKKYESLGGITSDNAINDAKKQAEEQKKLQQELYETLIQLRFQNQQDEINLMEEGSEKKRKQIELDYQKELAEIKKLEKELSDKSGGKLTQEQSIEISRRYTNADDRYTNGISEIEGGFTAEELKKSMNEYLASYGEYVDKRNAIIALGEEKKKGKNEWEQKIIDEETYKVLSDLDIEAAKTTSAISGLFGDMKDKTLKDLQEINQRGQEALKFLKSGEWDKEKGVSLGITKEQFDTLSKSPDKLKDISDALIDNKRAAEELKPSYDKIIDGIKDFFNAGNDSKKLKQAISDIQSGMNDILQVGSFLENTFSSLGDAFGSDTFTGISEGIGVAMDAMNSAMQGAQAGAMFGPIGAAAGAAIGLVSSLASSIAQIHDKKNEKRIQELQDQIDTLGRSYEKLGKSIDESYSKDASKLIEQNNTILKQQKFLIQQQIKEEQDKKKTDDERIKEWQQKIEDIDELIEENKEAAIDAIFGEDLQSAIEEFSSAYIDAWSQGEDKATSARDTVKQMMQQMVTESIKAAIQGSKSMEEIRSKLQEFYADNVLSGWEQDYIYNMAEELQKELDKQFGWADDLFKDSSSEQQSASSRGFETMSQDTADELNGRFTALYEVGLQILQNISSLQSISVSAQSSDATLLEIKNLMILSNGHLEDISTFAKKILEGFGKKLDDINTNLKNAL